MTADPSSAQPDPEAPWAPPDFSHWHELVRRAVSGRRWLCTGDALPPVARVMAELRALGGGPCFGVASSRGTGDVEFAEGDRHAVLNISASDMMGGIHASEAALAALPVGVLQDIEAFDPDRRARVIGPLFAQAPTVAGRGLLGARPLAWRLLEDKVIIDDLWDAAGVPRAPFRIVPARLDALTAAVEAIDQGDGTVWSADNRDGWYGGASRVRWVRDAGELAAAAAWIADRADQVRVMPFLDGTPCSIHGFVFPDTVFALRPVEMLVLRRPDGMFHYAKAATFWDPAPEDREDMRDFARRVGVHLRETVGYRGTFTIDGIMTRDGFRPTELNPRFGAAMYLMFGGLPKLPLYLLNLLIAEGLDLDWRPDDLEAVLLAQADGQRAGGSNMMTARTITTQERLSLVRGESGWREAEEGEDPHANAALGPAASGGFARVALRPNHTPRGCSVAPRVAELIAFLDEHWELGVGPVSPAPDVRLNLLRARAK
jgi:hypothetical protein